MGETWEALDVDDSDIPSLSLLRPCKRPDTAAAINPKPFLRPCSNRSSETLEPKPAQNRRIIPGPAGAVQSAMLQKALDREKETGDLDPVSTQDYIRRAVENAPEFDDDFTRTPWLSALHFIGTVDGVVPSVPLSSFNQCENVGKVDRIVAVIKSRSHSVLGGLMVTLKDPTGTIGASVHHKLLSENQFSQDFVIGSVLILEKVAIFSPLKSMHYLNIMPNNLVKVFKKDTGTSSGDRSDEHSIINITPGEGKSGSPENRFIPETGSCEEMLDVMEQPIDGRGRMSGCSQSKNVPDCRTESLTGRSRCSLNASTTGKEPLIISQGVKNGFSEDIIMEKAGDESLTGKSRCSLNANRTDKEPLISSQGVRNGFSEDIIMEIASDESLTGRSRCGLKANTTGKEPLTISQWVRNGFSEDIIMEKAGDDQRDFSHCIDRVPKAGDPKLLSEDTEKRKRTNRDEEMHDNSTSQSQKQSLPSWTDEQLAELFAGQDDDDGAFF